ncbi:MAG: hypothetical protein J6J06_02635 [Bacteroidaceae bacterium]|nr:hypothetical protein [Bacteroidaceae bacterium]
MKISNLRRVSNITKSILTPLFFSGVMFTAFPLNSFAQGITPLIYEPIRPSSNNNTEATSTVDAYYISNGNFIRTKITVSENQFGLYVTRYLYSNGLTVEWRNCSRSLVQTVNQFSDGKTIAENFYYKAYIHELGKWVYF